MANSSQVRPDPWSRRRICGLLTLAAGLPARAWAEAGASAWSVGAHARMRLIDAGPAPQGAGQRLAGIELVLEPQYLTYWRSPGEAGVPPAADFAGSTNLRGATLLFPAPGRFSEDGVEAIGYKNNVVFPVLATPGDAAQPITLALDLSFATCERLCVPGQAKARLTLEGPGDKAAASLVREALARVPASAAIGEAGPLAITAVTPDEARSSVTVVAQASAADVPLLFAEAPDPWFVQAGAGLWSNDGSLTYKVGILAKPAEPAPLPLRLTLVGVEKAIEVVVTLDPPASKP